MLRCCSTSATRSSRSSTTSRSPPGAGRGHGQDRGHRRVPLRPVGHERHAPAPAPAVLGPRGRRDHRRRSARASPPWPGRPRHRRLVAAVRSVQVLHRPQAAPPVHRDPVRHAVDARASPQDGSPSSARRHRHVRRVHRRCPTRRAVKIDDDIPFEIASLIGCGVMTGVGAAINTAKVTPGSTVVVFGCGGVGISAIQGARIAGAARSSPSTSSTRKLEQAKPFGATHACKPDDLAPSRPSSPADGFDYAFEAIGLPGHDAGRVRRRPPRRHRLHHRRRRDGPGGRRSTPSSSSSPRRRFVGSYYGSADVRTTSTGCSACGRPASSTSRA